MNIRKLVLLFAGLLGLAATAFAQTVNTEATVARVTGAVTVTLPNGGATVPLLAGMKVAQGSTIKTGADGDVYLESHAGYVTAIKKDSTVLMEEISVTTMNGKVTEEKTLLDLKNGNLVAKLDPTKKAVNNYQVRTPKGVAAARGTVFTVQYRGGTYTIAVVNGVVSVTPPSGSFAGASVQSTNVAPDEGRGPRHFRDDQPFTVSAGELTQRADGASGGWQRFGYAEYAASTKDMANQLREIMALAVATVAVAAQNNIGGTTAQEAADVAKAVLTAVPSAAAEAAALMKQSGVGSGAVMEAIKAVVPATQSDSFNRSINSGTFQQTTVHDNQSTPTTITPQPIDPTTVSRSS